MKEKLLKLIYACVEDDKFVGNRGFSDSISIDSNHVEISSVSLIEYNGEKVSLMVFNHRYKCDVKDQTKFIESLSIDFNFSTQPSINIHLVEIKGGVTTTIERQTGIKRGMFKDKQIEFDLTVVNKSYKYQLKCGHLQYDIDTDVVVDIYNRIIEKRKELKIKEELVVLGKRFEKYKIS